MNEEPPTHPEHAGDDPVEARIVAWVLGEASAFEAAELERLCEEKPELLAFRRRMRELHGLLAEAEAGEPDDAWKLPAEKRKVLDELFGQQEQSAVAADEVARDRRVNRTGRRALLAIAACVTVTLFVVRLVPTGYEAEATIEIRPSSTGVSALGFESTHAPARMTPQFFGTEFEKIKSHNSLGKVVDQLGLTTRWGMDRESAIRRIKENIRTDNIRGTDLISIRVREKTGQDAREITTAVTQAYADYRRDLENRAADKALVELNKAVRDQEDKVEERRKVLASIARNKGIIYKGQGSFYGESGVNEVENLKDDTREDAIKRGLDAQDYADAKRDFETDQEVLQQMRLKQMDRTIRDKMTDESIVIHQEPKAVKRGIDILGGSWFSSGGEKDVLADSSPAQAVQPSTPAVQPSAPSKAEVPSKVALEAEVGALARNDREGEVRYKLDGKDRDSTPLADLQAEARQQQLAKNLPPADAAAPSPAEPQGMPELAESSEMKALPRAEQDMSVAGNGNGFAVGGPARQPRPRIVPPAEDSVEEQEHQVASKPNGITVPADDEFDMVKRLAKEKQAAIDGLSSWNNFASSAGRTSGPALEPDGAMNYHLNTEAGTKTSAMDQQYLLGGIEHSPGAEADRFSSTGIPAPANTASSVDSLSESRAAEDSAAGDGLTVEHGKKLDDIRRSLYIAEGNFNLGKYDEAKTEYENALRVDPFNGAARRGLESVEVAKSDYYRAAHDLTRAELLAQVDAAWELSVPAGKISAADDLPLMEKDKELLAKRASALEKEITGAGDKDSKKAKFREWEAINRELIRRASQEAERKPVEVIEETSAADNPYSTFSLNISDASFQTAKAALEKGVRPDPASIKPEQFYNAVDYGDPAPSAGEPVAATIEQAAHPVTPGRTLVRVAVRTGASGRSAAQPLRLTLLVDQSGSMVREDRRTAMDRALSQLSGLLTQADVVNVIGFSRTPHLLAEGMPGDKSGKLSSLVNQTASEGGTNLEEALKLGGQIATRHQLAGAQNRIVLFTDGAANLGDADPARLADQVKTLRQKGISFDIAGIAADDLNDQLLGELARNGNGRYYVVGAEGKEDTFARQLAGAFRPAAENVKIQVIFNPRRVAKYKLIGFEKDRLRTEDFRNDSVDAAELAAEETGTAIYQVEEIPGGAGEIGELSIRFRDTASGEMVERSWMLPHSTTVPALDRATPSMQLAGLSLLAAEKLRGGPLADSIDFKQLSSTIGSVKQFYGSSSRAADMLRLIDSIK